MSPVDKRTFIIAEAGVNHNGSVDRALEMVDVAARAGADAIKFQTFDAQKLVTDTAPKADYQSRNTDAMESQRQMLLDLELDREAHVALSERCGERQIEFLSTAFDEQSLDFLIDLGMQRIKIPSGEITNLPFLRHVAQKKRPVILSTGMANFQEVADALNALINGGMEKQDITVLHCSTAYPTPIGDVNLGCLETLGRDLQVEVGYSDHTLGDEVAIAAVALGAMVIEKHFTLDRTLPGPDQQTSLEPDELAAMVKRIRHIDLAMGDGIKQPQNSERENIAIARRSLVAARTIAKGERFSADNLMAKRPGTGLSPMRWDEVIGRTADRDYQPDDLIEL